MRMHIFKMLIYTSLLIKDTPDVHARARATNIISN